MIPRSEAAKRRKIEKLYERSRRKHFPELGEMEAEELRARLADGGIEDLVIVDVRSEEERAVSMIEGAITAAEFERQADSHRDATVVAYCTTGHRSGLFAKKLCSEGFDARNLRGSILAWTHVDGRLVDERGPTRRVHVWGPPFRLQAEGYEPVW